MALARHVQTHQRRMHVMRILPTLDHVKAIISTTQNDHSHETLGQNLSIGTWAVKASCQHKTCAAKKKKTRCGGIAGEVGVGALHVP
jgi:hypothetical protein